ncbi:flavin reductase (DIM6/NTAB) family NADH-FMN oxidoreductase RutF [Paenibacillus jamilae]|jgi:flavin reductase (DIM6/NTAB) family NADH-FMN oxidoreductase RutF|uniref:flavin reductase family protein n=1 Tax=Paenibacillus polymyxa TaxID=1406 RepID=UPI000D307B47|nr:flavin reductase family protein [Paenibacillus polymyxa]MDP9678726.1 flavin reductase (DIM6/NTAB) family NADH-FMN oxidoreductase RutF [Paenibacillus jamilae]MBY0022454.1 flavin reductase family protein [Paenibacillus polymyxa]MBY0058576.1 flavin reductase family protein [Paenibacillus polymyxa]MBY0072115.1 flavin reductase family protein [Paenibacillus polymyxa]MBY0082913.1 flavin reductase family protein [Paenibacillus polymyxa]
MDPMNPINQMNRTPSIKTINPSILYYGTPVILLNTLNEDGTTNISPISSSWALGDCVVLGIGTGGKALENMERHPECVINVPGPSMWENVERLAPFTGKNPVPVEKEKNGFSYQKDKYEISGLAAIESNRVKPTRIRECPIQIEAKVKEMRIPNHSPYFAIVETQAIQVHVHQDIILGENHIDPAKWSPLIYNFRHYFGLGEHLGKTFRSET